MSSDHYVDTINSINKATLSLVWDLIAIAVSLFRKVCTFSELCQSVKTSHASHSPVDECVGSLMSPASHFSEDAGDRTYGLLSLSEKTGICNDDARCRLQIADWVENADWVKNADWVFKAD